MNALEAHRMWGSKTNALSGEQYEQQCEVAESISKRAPLSGIRIFLYSNAGGCLFSFYKM